jgi:hypothetical protein
MRNGAQITLADTERWIAHMEAAFDATPEFDKDSRRKTMAFLRHTAFFIYKGVEMGRARQQQQQQQHVPASH